MGAETEVTETTEVVETPAESVIEPAPAEEVKEPVDTKPEPKAEEIIPEAKEKVKDEPKLDPKPKPKKEKKDPEPEKPKEESGDSGLAKELETVKGELTSANAQIKELGDVIDSILQEKIKTVPEEFVALVPEGSNVAQLDWVTKAEEKGLFKKKNPAIEIGKNLDLGATENSKPKEKLTAIQKMANQFGVTFKK